MNRKKRATVLAGCAAALGFLILILLFYQAQAYGKRTGVLPQPVTDPIFSTVSLLVRSAR